MDIKKTIIQAVTTKMNRRQFLIQAGGTLLALVGNDYLCYLKIFNDHPRR
jgi:hypothetical protein